jgi:5-methyltetrahydrofolate--homocysteine methyltransferase
MPARKIVNRAFMVMAIPSGLDGAITNPTDRDMMSSILAAEALVGRDNFCENSCNAYRDGLLAV